MDIGQLKLPTKAVAIWVTVIFLIVNLPVTHGKIFSDHLEGDGNGEGQNWAVLIAGSKTWKDYRHQADVCHAYQVISIYKSLAA